MRAEERVAEDPVPRNEGRGMSPEERAEAVTARNARPPLDFARAALSDAEARERSGASDEA